MIQNVLVGKMEEMDFRGVWNTRDGKVVVIGGKTADDRDWVGWIYEKEKLVPLGRREGGKWNGEGKHRLWTNLDLMGRNKKLDPLYREQGR